MNPNSYVRRVTEALHASIANGRPLSAHRIEAIEHVAAAAAQDGLPIESLRDACYLALSSIQNRSQEDSLILEDEPTDILGIAFEVWEALTRGYVRRVRQESTDAQSLERAHGAGEFLEAALDGRLTPRLGAARGPGSFHFLAPGTLTLVVGVVRLPASGTDLQSLAKRLRSLLPTVVGLSTRLQPERHVAALVPGPITTQVEDLAVVAHAIPATLISASAENLGEVAVLYERIRRQLRPAAVMEISTPLVGVEHFRIFELLSYSPPEAAERFVRETIGPLLGQPPHRAKAFVATLHALHRCQGNVKEAASGLHLTERGVRVRIERMVELTGIGERELRGSSRIAVALHLLVLHEPSLNLRR